MCEHLKEATSRYDPAKKLLTFVLICRICGTERVVEQLEYEPRPKLTFTLESNTWAAS
jgi:hypothetical protein